ncbi:MAG TPA: hypothetical protein DCX92_06195 [Bacteroidetes bacterium]|nr:hypothetical protein [Bacteroidota bacterium]HRE09582.1 hypothetical protein [Ignavibacteria bacterium]
MKVILIIIISLFTLTHSSKSQNIEAFQKVNGSGYRHTKGTDFTNSFFWGSVLVISPTLVLEDKKAYFGLSKELSAGKYPFGRVELDYTYIFRGERTSAFHLSYNQDIPLNGNFSQPSLFMISPGGGYYTDLTRKGIFVQAAIGLWASTGFMDGLSIHPNLKFRKVFMKDGLPGVFEISLGVGFGFYTR